MYGTALAVLMASCSTGGAADATGPAAELRDCPPAPAPPERSAAPGRGIPGMATSVTPVDTSTSTVLTGLTGAQIQCGRREVSSHLDVVHSTPELPDGSTVPLRMDVLVPAGDGAWPLIVYMTGGGFQFAEKTNGLNVRTYLAETGYVVASIEYRTLRDGAVVRDAVADVKSAVRFLRAHAGEYRIDPERVALWGESAGGYLAAMAGTTNGVAEFEVGDNLDRSSAVQAVVDKFGASDLTGLAADFDPAAQQVHAAPGNFVARFVTGRSDATIADDPQSFAAANPLTYIDPTDPPFLTLHGSADNVVSASQTLLLHDALRAAGVDSTRYVLDGAGHGDLAFLLGDPAAALPWSTQEVLDRITGFLDSRLGLS
jgi:acetyl esterase/lipase